MHLIEHTPSEAEILDFINDSVRQLQEAGAEAKYILLGPEAYETLRHAMAARFKREPGLFETYNYLPIVVDPFRAASVCVLPAPAVTARDAHAYRLEDF